MSDTPFAPVRRVVTGHAGEAARVLLDGPAANARHSKQGTRSTLIWCSDRMPAEIAAGTGIEDLGARILGTPPPPNGTRFTVNDFPPGNPPVMHRTETLDYVIVMAGEIDMILDDGATTTLRAGDVIVQRGTNHAWVNNGTVTARVAFVLIDAEPLGIGHPVTRDRAASAHS